MKRERQQLLHNIQQILAKMETESLAEALIVEREKVAQECLTSAISKKEGIKRWLAISYLLTKSPWKGEGTPANHLVELLITFSEEILERENDIFRLSKGLAKVILVDGLEEVAPTELDVLSCIPDDVLEQYKKQLVFPHEIVADLRGDVRTSDVQIIKEVFTQPELPFIVGDELYRELKSIYHGRILPAIAPSNVDTFISTSLRLAGFLAFQLGSNFANEIGILRTDLPRLTRIRSLLFGEVGAENTEFFFRQFKIHGAASPATLGGTVILATEKDRVFLPYFSIFLLVYLCMRWSKKPEKGEFLRYIGKSVEDLIFSFIKAYDLNTDHPILKKPLLRVPHPEKGNEEIADIMGYDSKYLVVIESKFREALTTVDLDVELTKFFKNIDYIRSNMAKFGFSGALEIKPFFYTPFPPYSEWNGIVLTPSLVLLGIELSKLVASRPTRLVSRSQQLQQLLLTINDSTPYPIDCSTVDYSLSPDTYRLQDGVVEDCDEDEIIVLVDNPIGLPTVLIVDINEEVHTELETKSVGKGDIIKMVLLNLNKAWSQVQLVEFKLIGIYPLPRDGLDTFGLLSILGINSAEKSVEKLIHQTWGEKTAEEILRLLKKWNIDFTKFVQHQLNKGQNVLIGVGKMLGLSDTYDVIVQCDCGEVMGFTSDYIEIFRKLYPDGRIQCDRCDPRQFERLEKMGHHLVRIDHSVLSRYMLSDSRENESSAERK